ncbi:hypothetical protein SAM19_02077 [Brevibacillus laterosporus]|nr:hypothetical protein [Brevibacillus laterosporus]
MPLNTFSISNVNQRKKSTQSVEKAPCRKKEGFSSVFMGSPPSKNALETILEGQIFSTQQ